MTGTRSSTGNLFTIVTVKPEEQKKFGFQSSNLEDKATICKSTVWRVILHGCETWVSHSKVKIYALTYSVHTAESFLRSKPVLT
jgi:hypothetical protein